MCHEVGMPCVLDWFSLLEAEGLSESWFMKHVPAHVRERAPETMQVSDGSWGEKIDEPAGRKLRDAGRAASSRQGGRDHLAGRRAADIARPLPVAACIVRRAVGDERGIPPASKRRSRPESAELPHVPLKSLAATTTRLL